MPPITLSSHFLNSSGDMVPLAALIATDISSPKSNIWSLAFCIVSATRAACPVVKSFITSGVAIVDLPVIPPFGRLVVGAAQKSAFAQGLISRLALISIGAPRLPQYQYIRNKALPLSS